MYFSRCPFEVVLDRAERPTRITQTRHDPPASWRIRYGVYALGPSSYEPPDRARHEKGVKSR